MDKRINNGLMAINLFATILVIAIHYASKSDYSVEQMQSVNYYFQEFFVNGIARVAVPFFALISGYFMRMKMSKGNSYRRTLREKSRTLFIPYVVASVLIFVATIGLKLVIKHESYPFHDLFQIVKDLFLHPLSIQFWFLRDLMILSLIYPILLSASSRLYKSLLVVLFVFWLVEYQPWPMISGWYLISTETLFFFVAGGGLFDHREKIFRATDDHLFSVKILMFIWIGLIIVRMIIDPKLDVWYASNYTGYSLLSYKFGILSGMLVLLKMSVRIKPIKEIVYLSGLTFFAYLFHYVPLSYFRAVTDRVVSYEHSFYLNFPIAVISVFLCGHLLSRISPRLFALISGGRGPEKSLSRL